MLNLKKFINFLIMPLDITLYSYLEIIMKQYFILVFIHTPQLFFHIKLPLQFLLLDYKLVYQLYFFISNDRSSNFKIIH